jgi:hypothetical protein
MARVASKTSFGSSIFGRKLNKGDVFVHQVKRTLAMQVVGESTRGTIGMF